MVPEPQSPPLSVNYRILVLAMPVFLQNMLGMFVGWSDSILAGKILIDPKFLAAITVCNYLVWMLESTSELISTGTRAIVARAIGADNPDEAMHVTEQSLLLGFLLGITLWGLVWIAIESGIAIMQLDASAVPSAVRYLRIVAISCPFLVTLKISIASLQAAGKTFSGMIILTVVNAVNITFSWMLTVGAGSLPRWGWEGIAMGTMLSYLAGGSLALGWLLRGSDGVRVRMLIPRPDFAIFRRILVIGIPGAANTLGIVFCQLWFLSIINGLGPHATATHGVAIRCESISWLTAQAYAIAAATLVGQSLGQKSPLQARRCGWACAFQAAITVSSLGVIFFVFAPQLFALFVSTEHQEGIALIEQGVPLLRLVALAMPGLAFSVVLTGGLRGAGDTRWPLIYDTTGLVGVRIPLTYWLTSTPLGLFGAWIAMAVDLYTRGLFATLRFRSKGWSSIEV